MDFVIFDQLHALRSENFDCTTQQVVARLFLVPTSFGPARRQIELLLPQHSIGVGVKAQMGGEGISSDQRQGNCKT